MFLLLLAKGLLPLCHSNIRCLQVFQENFELIGNPDAPDDRMLATQVKKKPGSGPGFLKDQWQVTSLYCETRDCNFS